MWKEILDFGARLLTLSKELEQNRTDIKEIRQDLNRMALALQRLSDEIVLARERESSEREKLALQLENELLKFDRRLPPQ
jgi:predicted  nucleic acid-binding Zn-ribbon protein